MTLEDFMLKERKDLVRVRTVGEVWDFQLMGETQSGIILAHLLCWIY